MGRRFIAWRAAQIAPGQTTVISCAPVLGVVQVSFDDGTTKRTVNANLAGRYLFYWAGSEGRWDFVNMLHDSSARRTKSLNVLDRSATLGASRSTLSRMLNSKENNTADVCGRPWDRTVPRGELASAPHHSSRQVIYSQGSRFSVGSFAEFAIKGTLVPLRQITVVALLISASFVVSGGHRYLRINWASKLCRRYSLHLTSLFNRLHRPANVRRNRGAVGDTYQSMTGNHDRGTHPKNRCNAAGVNRSSLRSSFKIQFTTTLQKSGCSSRKRYYGDDN